MISQTYLIHLVCRLHVLFADDTNLFFSDNPITDLKTNIQCNLNNLFNWLSIIKVSLSVSKSSLLLFNIRNKNNNVKLNININDIKIKQVTNLKFLGIIIDDKLDWKSQINYVGNLRNYLELLVF